LLVVGGVAATVWVGLVVGARVDVVVVGVFGGRIVPTGVLAVVDVVPVVDVVAVVGVFGGRIVPTGVVVVVLVVFDATAVGCTVFVGVEVGVPPPLEPAVVVGSDASATAGSGAATGSGAAIGSGATTSPPMGPEYADKETNAERLCVGLRSNQPKRASAGRGRPAASFRAPGPCPEPSTTQPAHPS
jgi:hypothetical protein